MFVVLEKSSLNWSLWFFVRDFGLRKIKFLLNLLSIFINFDAIFASFVCFGSSFFSNQHKSSCLKRIFIKLISLSDELICNFCSGKRECPCDRKRKNILIRILVFLIVFESWKIESKVFEFLEHILRFCIREKCRDITCYLWSYAVDLGDLIRVFELNDERSQIWDFFLCKVGG